MPKGFTENEKTIITEKLIRECKSNWQKYGYKKTSIDVLCRDIGISKGSFYSFFDTKEALFYQVIKETQENLYEIVEDRISQNQSKYGVAEALKEIYLEYSKSSFMYDTKNPDFLSFFNKLSEQQRKELTEKSYVGTKFMLNKPFLSLKIDEDLAISILTAMLTSISQKDNMLCDSVEVFGFMIDNLIDDIFN
ncbi:TetR family transcriptional regulator [Clostridium botulinum B2 128]|uniref:TetR/AcrR family transcriptional regulator n=1 Tax=Clostridium botulinum TaxID=1491 RepID=UPI0007E21A89|nr:TetR/AcrR family transcriptional regulator [Clostridium botulinum]KEI74975.1 TetR family transcriptional regulator [Clostridium botulinum B2 128]KEI88701.1 TetR family transcriptional regulator [Clostridium botulinum B2 433]NFI42784.1 TetR/AcrR family transcriptional regulator [Clostridium botulinum]NFI77465.1 TetR/AcrR family transcriptional regulator [Clostridium botulinum]NFI83922.1 TetR/AcrR family transcriptional regulator [Clostridium botulinum]